ncbi:SulP family inorganic anion transporter [Alkalicoccus luteus]|uniref:Sulfate permease n=1 Tax=Alkalicoccus luteus TaxID=1237094 RepID=A0A969PTQ7_9BACI|nr:sulfate permease [Alkalicoccus luteus]NJP38954.1 sulfate permease [Alkalicoccus luteus]
MKSSWLDWMRPYQKEHLQGDISAGLIVAVMLIPQGMAYAMLAGMPPVTGLYAAAIPILIYAMIGSSRQLAVGPVAVVSLLVFAGVSPLAEPGSGEYVTLAVLLMLMVGVIQLLMGVFRLGFITKFFSHAVISGFTSAAAIVIAFSQLKHVVGIPLESSQPAGAATEAVMQFSSWNWAAVGLSAAGIAMILAAKRFIPMMPGPLAAVLLGIGTVIWFNLDGGGVSIIGEVPGGLPALSLPSVTGEAALALLPTALTISFIGFMESFAMAKVIAAKEKQYVSADRELSGLGAANIGGSFFGGFPVTGGFSRSAVNYDAGAKTPLASVITAVLLLLTLQFFTGAFYYLPNAILASVIIVAVYKLIDWREAIALMKLRRADGAVWLITFAATLLIGVEQGIFIGIGASLAVFIWSSAYPHTAELGWLEESGAYRNVKRYPHAEEAEGIFMLRIDAPLYFANAAFVESKIEEGLKARPQTKQVILDFSGVNSIDAVAVHELESWERMLRDREMELKIVDMKGPVRDILRKAGWQENRLYLTMQDSYQTAHIY